MERMLSLNYNLTEEEYRSFILLVNFLQRQGFPIDFKAILQAGLNELMSNYFAREWGKKNGISKAKKGKVKINPKAAKLSTD